MTSLRERYPLSSGTPLLVAACYALAVVVPAHAPLREWVELVLYYARNMYPIWLLVGVVLLFIQMIRDQRGGKQSSIMGIVRGFAKQHWDYDRGFSFLMPPILATVLLATYNMFKQRVLPNAGFSLDSHLAGVDRSMFGTDAWQLTHGWLPSPWVTQAIDILYHPLFFPMTIAIALCSFMSPQSEVRFRYLLGYTLLWSVVGSMFAFLMPAAGPCFDYFFHGTDVDFRPLTDLLAQQHAYLKSVGAPGLYALSYQDHLLSLFGSEGVALGGGISAIPSLHNGMTALFVCAAISWNRKLAFVLVPYSLIIWFGSVHLGWHYAIDGIVGNLLAIACWMMTRSITPQAYQQGSRRYRPDPGVLSPA
jgi:hypothetical protein